MTREIDDDIAADYRHEQAYHDNLGRPKRVEGMVPRYWWGYDCPDSTTCDKVYIDRVTGHEVGRYDAADPANTRFDYGATPDADWFAGKGLVLGELVKPEDCALTEAQCKARMAVAYDYYDDPYDDYPYPPEEYDYDLDLDDDSGTETGEYEEETPPETHLAADDPVFDDPEGE